MSNSRVSPPASEEAWRVFLAALSVVIAERIPTDDLPSFQQRLRDALDDMASSGRTPEQFEAAQRLAEDLGTLIDAVLRLAR